MKNKTILAIGAHFDDIEIGVGGTILKHIENGDQVFLAITHSDEIRTGSQWDRHGEQIKAMEKMGLDSKKSLVLFRMYDTKDQHYRKQDYDYVVEKLDLLKPDIIYAPWEHDTHQHHRTASKIGQSVGRKKYITTMFYDSGSSYDFTPNVFSFINFNNKAKVFRCFRSQIECGAVSLDLIKKKEAYWASLVTDANKSHAEGFIVRKLIHEI